MSPFVLMGVMVLLPCSGQSTAHEKRAITSEDCVRTRRPVGGEVKLSPDGHYVAYLIKAPNLRTNKNDYRVYVRDLQQLGTRENGNLIFSSGDVSGLTWLSDNSRLAFLVRNSEKSTVVIADIRGSKLANVFSSAKRVSSFSVSGDGQVIAFSVNLSPDDRKAVEEREARGFAVKFGEPVEKWRRPDWWPNSAIFVVQNGISGRARQHRICDRLFSAGDDPCVIQAVSGLSLSPDGMYLTFNYRPAHTPPGWRSNFVYRWLSSGGIPIDALVVYDLRSRRARIAFDAPDAGFEQPTVWAQDSRSFTVVSLSPIGSSWESEDRAAGFNQGIQLESHTHLFAVDAGSLTVLKVLDSLPVWSQNPTLAWKSSKGPLLVRKSKTSIAWLVRGRDEWDVEDQLTLPHDDFSLRTSASTTGSSLASDGRVVIGIAESPMSPPEILKYDIGSAARVLLTRLNPEYDDIALGEVEKINWKNSYGADCSGYLIKPVGYQQGRRYPLVVMTKGWNDSFLSDTQYQTAFPPQPLANAGFVVLMANMPGPKLGPNIPVNSTSLSTGCQ